MLPTYKMPQMAAMIQMKVSDAPRWRAEMVNPITTPLMKQKMNAIANIRITPP